MSNVKPQPTRQIEQELTKTEEGPEGGAWTPLPSAAGGLVASVRESQQCVVLGRRPAVTQECQPRRTA